jgi:hypothetical protein
MLGFPNSEAKLNSTAVFLGGLALLWVALPILPAQDPAVARTSGDVSLVAAPAAAQPYIPQTVHERWHGYWHETLLGTQPAVRILGTAFLEHLGRQPHEWGMGVQGYSHRVENRLYSTMIDGTVHDSLAALLHHDTRYLPAQSHNPWRRVGHGLRRTFFTYSQSGARVFDISGLGGIYAGSMLPMYWHPRRYSPLGQGVRAGNFAVVFQAVSNIAKEFQPDLKRLISKKPAGSPKDGGE